MEGICKVTYLTDEEMILFSLKNSISELKVDGWYISEMNNGLLTFKTRWTDKGVLLFGRSKVKEVIIHKRRMFVNNGGDEYVEFNTRGDNRKWFSMIKRMGK